MVRTDRARIDLSLLPPSPRAAHYHGLRVHHQIKVWKTLSDTYLGPIQWGWKRRNDSFVPIMTDQEPGPSDLLKIVRCTCKEMRDKCCSCRKAGLTCTSLCKECHGLFCNNSEQIEETYYNNNSNKVVILDIFLMHFCKIIYCCSYIVLRLCLELFFFKILLNRILTNGNVAICHKFTVRTLF